MKRSVCLTFVFGCKPNIFGFFSQCAPLSSASNQFLVKTASLKTLQQPKLKSAIKTHTYVGILHASLTQSSLCHSCNGFGIMPPLRFYSTSKAKSNPLNSAADPEIYYPPPFNPDQAKETHQRALKLEKRDVRRIVVAATAMVLLLYFVSAFQDVDAWIYRFGTWFMVNFMDPEVAHDWVIWMASKELLPQDLDTDDSALRCEIGGLHFPNPIGLAAGFDKNAKGALAFMKMGFGFVEVGTITPEPQPGNPKPRIFRLPEDYAIINRYGFNSEGADIVEKRLEAISKERWKHSFTTWNPLGVNIGKNKSSEDTALDIQRGIGQLGRFADYLVINVSSPNTIGLRDMQQRDKLKHLVDAAQTALKALKPAASTHHILKTTNESTISEHVTEGSQSTPHQDTQVEKVNGDSYLDTTKTKEPSEAEFSTLTGGKPLLFVKIAPDLTLEEKRDIAEVAMEKQIDGLIVANTTISRPSLMSVHNNEVGGLSGKPLKELSTGCVADMYRLTNGKIPIIACGGVTTGADALEKIEAGATLVQIYTSMIYGGPATVRRIKNELSYLFYKKGYHDVQSAVGSSFKKKRKLIKAPSFE